MEQKRIDQLEQRIAELEKQVAAATTTQLQGDCSGNEASGNLSYPDN